MSNVPDVSVVIPTRGREARLAFAVDALAAQTLDRDRYEVVVVRGDTSGPETVAPEGVDVRFLTAAGATSPAAKRNAGWREASAALIAFTDDDCRPDPDWLERLVAAASGTRAVLQGRTIADPGEEHLRYGLIRTREIEGPSDWFEACNIAYPRDLLEELGGFSDDYSFGGEDTDLGLRARAAGSELIYLPDAVVRHAILTPSLPNAVRAELERHSQALLIARHPEQRRAIRGGLFLRPFHATLLLALAGTIAFRRRPLLAAALWLPYLQIEWSRMTPRRLARTALTLPPRFAVDAAEVIGTIRGAIKHRVFLL